MYKTKLYNDSKKKQQQREKRRLAEDETAIYIKYYSNHR